MDKLTLRGAADRTGLSITTLRRYIRSGRLAAEMSPGRYGPEYYVSIEALGNAGLSTSNGSGTLARANDPDDPVLPGAPNGDRPSRSGSARGPDSFLPEQILREAVPIDLYRELAMKHEQLLVQYGMVRVGGQRLMEYKAEAEQLAEALRRAEEQARQERDRHERDAGFLRKHLRQAELEIEEKNQEISALQEKLRLLELISRNAITTESIEEQFLQVFDKRRELEELTATSSDERRRKLAMLDELLRSGFRLPPRGTTDQ